ncbi:hypothetical protein Bca101_093360 [Brassica carinata]
MAIPVEGVPPRSFPGRSKEWSTSREKLYWLDRTQYRFGVQKRQGSFRMERESNPDGGCHHRPVLPLGLPRPDKIFFPF